MADVASDLKTWSTTASSNTPTTATTIGTGLAPNLQEIQKVVRQDLAHKGADIASATTTDIGAVAGLMHDITGTTTITGLGTVSAGIWKVLKFEGVLTLTHNATSLILPGAANITTANGDVAIVISEGSGNWRCLSYTKASGAAGIAATQAEQEAGSSTAAYTSPGRQHFHPSAAKAWGKITAASTVDASYPAAGVSVNNSGTGVYVVTHGLTFSSANYAVNVVASGANPRFVLITSRTTTTFTVTFYDSTTNAAAPGGFDYSCYGDL